MVITYSLIALGLAMMIFVGLVVNSRNTHYIAAGVYFFIVAIPGFLITLLGVAGFIPETIVSAELMQAIQLWGSAIAGAPFALILGYGAFHALSSSWVADYPRKGYVCNECGHFWINTLGGGDDLDFKQGQKHYGHAWWCTECNSNELTECYIKRNFTWLNPLTWSTRWKFFQDYSAKIPMKVLKEGS